MDITNEENKMTEAFGSAVIIMFLRICDVTIGTFRTIMVIQGKKYLAGLLGFCEVLIWIFAMRYIVQHMDQTINLFGYATGFGLGNILGITLEQKIGLGFVQLNIISLHKSEQVAEALRNAKFGVTSLPAEGASGEMSIIILIIKRKDLEEAKSIIDTIDPKSFITIQHSRPFRGFFHGSRK